MRVQSKYTVKNTYERDAVMRTRNERELKGLMEEEPIPFHQNEFFLQNMDSWYYVGRIYIYKFFVVG